VNQQALPRSFTDAPVIFGGHANDQATMISPEQAAGKAVVLDYSDPAAVARVPLDIPRFAQAALIVGVQLDELGSEFLARVRSGRAVIDTSRNPQRVPVVWVSRRAAEQLLGAALQTLNIGASGKTVSGFVDVKRSPIAFPARNVVAILRGSDPALRNEYVSLTAHNDHV